MEKSLKKISDNQKKNEHMDGFVKIVDHPDLEYYESRLREFEARIAKLEQQLREIQQILMLGQS